MFRFGIMGAGGIAAKFCDAVRRLEGAEVAAVASKSVERAERFARENGVVRFYGDYEEMLERERPDAVYVATTNNFHFENVMLCIGHGVPVLCEKSMFMTLAEAEEAFGFARERKVFLMEAMWSRFLPCVQKAREWVAEGRIGTVQIANYTGGINAPAEHRIFKPELGGGAMYDLTVYPIEILAYLVNQPLVDVRAEIGWGSSGVDEDNSLLLKFETCHGAVQTTTHARIPSPCGLYGPKGYIRLEQTHRASAVELYDGEFRLVERFESEVENGFEYEAAEVMRCVKMGELESAVMPHRDTLECIGVFEKALKGGERRGGVS